MFSKQRIEELVDFIKFEKEYFMDIHAEMDQEDFDDTLANFNDTIEVVKYVLSQSN